MTWVAVSLKEIMEVAFDMDGLFMSFMSFFHEFFMSFS